MTAPDDCGRLTKAGTPCKISRMAADGWYLRRSHVAESCSIHATPEERAEFAAIGEEIMAEDERLRLAYHQALPVECWNWPVTDDDRRRAAEARDCADPEMARGIAWDLLADWQDDRCAVCKGCSDVLDHDHETGLVRGWLCRFCNSQEGHGYIPGGRYERYRAKNPASILGLAIRYYSPFAGWAGRSLGSQASRRFIPARPVSVPRGADIADIRADKRGGAAGAGGGFCVPPPAAYRRRRLRLRFGACAATHRFSRSVSSALPNLPSRWRFTSMTASQMRSRASSMARSRHGAAP